MLDLIDTKLGVTVTVWRKFVLKIVEEEKGL